MTNQSDMLDALVKVAQYNMKPKDVRQWLRENEPKLAEELGFNGRNTVVIACPTCGESFRTRRLQSRMFCSSKCRRFPRGDFSRDYDLRKQGRAYTEIARLHGISDVMASIRVALHARRNDLPRDPKPMQ